jgi:hypothetical protein
MRLVDFRRTTQTASLRMLSKRRQFRLRIVVFATIAVGSISILSGKGAPGSDVKVERNAAAPRFKIPKRFVPGFPPPRLDSAKVAIGERLFLETRFAQYFFAHSNGDANAVLAEGDSVVATTVTTGQPLPGPFRGFSMNCRSCHLVGEHFALGRGHSHLCRLRASLPSAGA